MKPVENPPRLAEHPEFGRDWSIAAQETIEPERLRQLGEGISQAVQGLGTGAAVGGAGPTVATTAKVLLPVLVVGAAATAYLLGGREEPPAEPSRPASVEAPTRPVVTEQQNVTEPDTIRKPVRKQRPSLAPQKQPAAAKIPQHQASELPEQLKEFRAAQREAGAGEYSAAITRLDQLEARFPQSPLSTDMELARADWLVRAGKYVEATVQIQKLLLNRDLAGKKGTLFQLLGDAWLKRGRCDRALGAYENALSHGVDGKQGGVVRAAMEKCAGQ